MGNPEEFLEVEDYYNEESTLSNGICLTCGGNLICISIEENEAVVICESCKQEA